MGYNPNEKRIPAGKHGGGQWTSGGGESSAIQKAASDKGKLPPGSPTKVGDEVEYRNPFADEKGTTYTIVEIRPDQNWALIRANVNMNIKPTFTANISDLKLVKKK